MTIRRLSTRSPDFAAELKNLLALEAEQDAGIERTVVEILADIRKRGDAALLITPVSLIVWMCMMRNIWNCLRQNYSRHFKPCRMISVLRWRPLRSVFARFMSASV